MHKYGFSSVQRRYYYKERTFDSKRIYSFAGYLFRCPDNGARQKGGLFQEIEEAILGCGGMVRIRDIMDLHLGKNL